MQEVDIILINNEISDIYNKKNGQVFSDHLYPEWEKRKQKT